jgi:hypothetical protein
LKIPTIEKTLASLNRIKMLLNNEFKECILGELINDIFVIDIINENYQPSIYQSLNNYVHLLYLIIKYSLSSHSNNEHYIKNRILVTTINNQQRLLEILYPIISHFPIDAYYMIGSKNSIFSNQLNFIDYKYSLTLNEALKFVKMYYSNLYFPINKELRQNHLSIFYSSLLFINSFIQYARYINAVRLLEKLSPTCLITEHDRNFFSAPIIQAAKEKCIFSYTFVHGIIDPRFGYTPLISNKAFCWGKLQIQRFIEAGEDPTRLIDAGCHFKCTYLDFNVSSEMKIQNNPNNPTILLASSPIAKNQRMHFAEEFCKITLELPNNYNFVIRLHPSEKIESYSDLISKYRVLFLESKSESPVQSILSSNIIVTLNSSLGHDAILLHKPIIVFNPINDNIFQAKDHLEYGKMPLTKNHFELSKIIVRITNDPEYNTTLHHKVVQYSKLIVSMSKKESVSVILKELRKYNPQINSN